jgi:hypothetical protein
MPLDDGAILLCDSSDPSNEPEETDNLCERQDDESAFITGIGDVPKAGER